MKGQGCRAGGFSYPPLASDHDELLAAEFSILHGEIVFDSKASFEFGLKNSDRNTLDPGTFHPGRLMLNLSLARS
jgi:hypothetical protein